MGLLTLWGAVLSEWAWSGGWMGIPEEPTSALPKDRTKRELARHPSFFVSYENLVHTRYRGR